MKNIIYSVIAGALLLSSCQKDDQKVDSGQSLEKVNLKAIAQSKNLLSANGIGAKWTNSALESIEEIDAAAKLPIANIGRKSRNCFGIGICEWFPKPVDQLASEGLSENQIVLPLIGLKADTDIIISSTSPEEDFVIEEDLNLENAYIAKGTYTYDESVQGYKIHVTVK